MTLLSLPYVFFICVKNQIKKEFISSFINWKTGAVSRLSGFFFYIFFIIVHLCIYNIFLAQSSYLYALVLYFITVAIYACFRNCFTILFFLKLHKIYIQLQRENTISNFFNCTFCFPCYCWCKKAFFSCTIFLKLY